MANIKNFDFDPNTPPECSYSGCTNLVERVTGERKWRKYCCKDCGKLGGAEKKRETFNKNFGKQNPEARKKLIQKRKDACIEKYGVDNPQKSESVREKTEQTNIQKYGVSATTMVPEFKQAIRETNIARYGCPTPLQNPEILEKMKATNLEKWGVEWTSLNPEVRRKQEETCLANYGVRNPLQSSQVRDRIQDTLVERYGVDNPTKNVDILEKALTSGKIVRPYTLPSGKTINLRGYEPIALSIILESYHEDDITYNIKDMPKINYQHEGKTRRYYPDFFLHKENTILEVKSMYTYEATKEVNYLKRDACVSAGYAYMFIIVSSGTIMVEYTDAVYDSVQEAAVHEASKLTKEEAAEIAKVVAEVLKQRKA